MRRQIIPNLALALVLAGCAASKDWETSAEQWHKEYLAATQRASDYQTLSNALPPGIAREKAHSASTQAIAAASLAADHEKQLSRLVTAQKADTAAQIGKATGAVAAAVPFLAPYSTEIQWGVTAIAALIAFLYRNGKAKALMHLDNATTAREAVGPAWTAEERAQIRLIQGDKTTEALKRLGIT